MLGSIPLLIVILGISYFTSGITQFTNAVVAWGTLLLAFVAFWAIQRTIKENERLRKEHRRLESERRKYESKQRLLDDLIVMSREILRLFPDLAPETGKEIDRQTKLVGSMAAFLEGLDGVKNIFGSDLESIVNETGTRYLEYSKALSPREYEPTHEEKEQIADAHIKVRSSMLRLLSVLIKVGLQH